jgi:hypothetical protein
LQDKNNFSEKILENHYKNYVSKHVLSNILLTEGQGMFIGDLSK